MSKRETQITEEIMHAAANFFARESNRESLITVTRVVLTPNHKHATIFFSVLPESYEKHALDFAKRMRSEFKKYLYDHTKIGIRPLVDFEIDYGEKNRQRIDDLTRT